MPTGPKGEKRPADAIGLAVKIARIATGEEVDAPSVAPKRATGAQKGGRARAAALSPEERKAIAEKAAKVRWTKSD